MRSNPLFFRQDGGMDLSQFILLVIVAWIVLVFTLAGFQVLAYTTAAWAFLGSFTSLAFIAWAAHDRAALIATSKTPGEVAKGIATAKPPYPGMDAGEKGADD
jgi:hypothetical protein